MNRGGKILSCTAVLAIAACGGEQARLEIRSTPSALARGEQPVPARIAEARGLLALGNVALALEAYRKAAREDPTSVNALLGIADCYDRMGRFDLSRRNYEAALAIEPGHSGALNALAASLESQGRRAEAEAVRGEIRTRMAAAEPPMPLPFAMTQADPEVAAVPLTVASAPQSPVVVAVMPPPERASAPAAPAAPVEMAAAVPIAPIGRTVTVALPPARPAAPAAAPSAPVAVAAADTSSPPAAAPALKKPMPVGASVAQKPIAIAAAPAPTVKPEPIPAPEPEPVRIVQAAVPATSGPRLQRLSLGEVALVTTRGPQWKPQLVRQTARSATVRFVPLQQARRTVPVRLLNAARVDKLAARTRAMLAQTGWRNMTIGNASAIRQRSLILYTPAHRLAARQLAARFGFASAQRASGRGVTILLGRDAANLARKRSAG